MEGVDDSPLIALHDAALAWIVGGEREHGQQAVRVADVVGADQSLESIWCEVVGVDEQSGATPRRIPKEVDVAQERTGCPEQRWFMADRDGHGLPTSGSGISLRRFPAVDELVDLIGQIVRIDQG